MTSSRQTKWKSRAVLAAVLAVGVVALCLFIGKMRERQPFVSKVVAGYRYRCKLSNGWKRMPDASNNHNTQPGIVESYTFSASPSPIREWIGTHLLHQTPAVRNPFTSSGRPELYLRTETRNPKPDIKVVAGYPELDMSGQSIPGMKAIPGKHFRVDNCPATLTGLDLTAFQISDRYAVVLISTPDYTNTYIIAESVGSNDSDQADREMQAILASFHVEKVAKSAGGKANF